MFLKVKRDGRVIGQTCVDGRKQCKKAVPGYANFPTSSTESVLISTIDAHEGCDVGICNIPGTFISAYMDEDVRMELHGM